MMILRIIKGVPGPTLENEVNSKITKGASIGLRLSEKLSVTMMDGGELIYSLWFDQIRKSKDSINNRFDFVSEPTDIERELMKCRNTQNLTNKQREIINLSKISLDDACALSRFYIAKKKLDTPDQNSLGMKRSFETIVNNLSSQIDIANEWESKSRGTYGVPPMAAQEPAWDWISIRDELIRRGESAYHRPWDGLSRSQQAYIKNMRPS
jgi:hypothetical protein